MSIVNASGASAKLVLCHSRPMVARFTLPVKRRLTPIIDRGRRSPLYSVLAVTLMGRIEFPTTPIGAVVKDGSSNSEQNGEISRFVQPTLEGLETEQPPEIELGNCIVTGSVTFRKRVKGNEWHCGIHVVPDLLHQDQEGEYEAFAQNAYADM